MLHTARWKSIFLYEFDIVHINKAYDNDDDVAGTWVNRPNDLD